MIDRAVEFTPQELTQIRNKLQAPNFSNNSWSDEDIANIKSKIKEHYLTEQNTTCPYCKRNLQTRHGRSWDIEHIIPRSTVENFMFEPLNLCMACVDCNGAKSDKKITSSTARVNYPSRSGQFLIIHPHFDVYEDYIMVIREGFYYVALEAKGAKTMDICNLNRFYEFAGYGGDVDNDDEIAILSNQLSNIDNVQSKQRILLKIAELSIKSAVG
ncbi:HNH endonuclease [Colwellia psychrerythraea]|uniref:HNH endonuclease n=1 Tax=Colwellia psychrerythraea TaxID=28229 RepID=A0A099KBE5_COLPS|nr:HNH endonuclease [Colwellia psychrerythraea]KGJ87631.1 HNH endonuclease [Colwellia psychrerythraea]